MKKRRSMVKVAPGKDVTLYIPADTPAEVIAYMNRLKAEGIFSQGIMDILEAHIVNRHESERTSIVEDAGAQWDDLNNEELDDTIESPEPDIPLDIVQEVRQPFSPQDIIRQAARNSGKLFHD